MLRDSNSVYTSSSQDDFPRAFVIRQDFREDSDAVLPRVNRTLELLPRDVLIGIVDVLAKDAVEPVARSFRAPDILGVEDEAEFGRHELNKLIRQLSSVSMTFRNTVLDTVSLWTKIDNNYCLRDGFETRIKLTKNAPLSLDIDLSDDAEWEKILALIFPLKDRWRNLRVYVTHNMERMVKAFSSTDFPDLASVWIEACPGDAWDMLFTEWTFPNVRSIELFEAVPPLGHFRNLTTFALKLGTIASGTDAAIRRLMDFLKQNQCLEKLSINVSGISNVTLRDMAIMDLRCVTTFSITNVDMEGKYNKYEDRSVYVLGHILRSFRLPKVDDFHLCVYFPESEDIRRWINSFSSETVTEVFHKVSSLTLMMYTELDADCIPSFFNKFPNVREIEVDATDFAHTLHEVDSWPKLDRLTTFVVDSYFEKVPWDWVADLRKFATFPEKMYVSCMEGRCTGYFDSEDEDGRA